MTLTELRYAITLAQEKHFGRAAKKCHVSQPTLSVAINKLENELGIKIFERDRNSIRVTEIGKEIIVQAKRAVDEADMVLSLAHGSQSQVTTPLKIGAIFTIGSYLFRALIPNLKKLAPHMPILIHEDYTKNLKTKLHQGELDAIFIALPFNEKGVVTKAIYEEPFVVVMRNDHPLSKKKSIAAKELSSDEMLLLGEGHCFRDQVIEACPNCISNTLGIQKITEGTSLETLRDMVASGLGMTVLPRMATQNQYYKSILCTRPFAGAVPKRQIGLAWRVSFTRPKAVSALIKAVQNSIMIHDVDLLP